LVLTKLEDYNEPPFHKARVLTLLCITVDIPIIDLLNRLSSLQKVLHVISNCFQFSKPRSDSQGTNVKNADEIACAISTLVYVVQRKPLPLKLQLCQMVSPAQNLSSV